MPESANTLPELTIAIATFGDRVLQLTADRLPQQPGVQYHIFAQSAPAAEVLRAHVQAFLTRSDIKLSVLDSIGAANSRNAALAAVTTPLLLFADDDLVILPEGHEALRQRFSASPDLGFLCCRVNTPDGHPRKAYSPDRLRAGRLNCGKVGTPELAVRVQAMQKAKVQFDPNFGAGAANWLGDEYIFLCDALRAGVQGEHADIVVALHPEESSGSSFTDQALTVRRRVLNRALGPWAMPLRWAFALRHHRKFPSVAAFLRFL